PGGNITGYSNMEPTIGAKWLETLHQLAPQIVRVQFIFNPDTSPISPPFVRSADGASGTFGVEVSAALVHEASDLESIIKSLANHPGSRVLIFPPDGFT